MELKLCFIFLLRSGSFWYFLEKICVLKIFFCILVSVQQIPWGITFLWGVRYFLSPVLNDSIHQIEGIGGIGTLVEW